jgi:hypothetical protein
MPLWRLPDGYVEDPIEVALQLCDQHSATLGDLAGGAPASAIGWQRGTGPRPASGATRAQRNGHAD